jgi:subtilisin family serine protease
MRFLVKSQGAPADGSFTMGARPAKFTAEPLFRSIGAAAGLGVAAKAPSWFLVTADAGLEAASPWDACHALMAEGLGVAAGGVEFVEPDLLQRWPVAPRPVDAAPFALREGGPHPQNNKDFPAIAGNDFWFRDDRHGQFDAALAGLDDPGEGKRTRIAHLDTGFDPDHRTRPAHLSEAEQRNFVDADAPNDARDRSSGPFNNFSHGAGTLSILAGAPVAAGKGFGCAPHAEVIPIRVADRVVLFRNSAIARAFDYVHGLCGEPATRVHVLSMSMGGLPSQAWAEAINALYEAGVFVVTAAGNNYGNVPSHFIVYPARFDRVVAACGVMADGTAYADLKATLMAGDYGPDLKMANAIAAYTPNVPWARFGEADVVDFDGAGTSAATPQVAGAAALWIQKHRADYDGYLDGWMRVEAVRKALFDGAAADVARRGYFGAGQLRIKDALDAQPATPAILRRQPEADASRAVFKILFGVGLAAAPAGSAMLELELRQIVQATGLEARLSDGDDPRVKARLVDEILSMPAISHALRDALRGPAVAPAPKPAATTAPAAMIDDVHLDLALNPPVPAPPMRLLRIFAYDPSLQTDPMMFGVNEAVVSVFWEADLAPGPVGEYLEIVDVDPASRSCYAPVDLNHPYLLTEGGLAPSESNPQFHQQMVYAVAMRTIARFERALGRKALWAARLVRNDQGEVVDRAYIQRLRIYPHALRERNAYYSSERMALLFGYFRSGVEDSGTTLPGSQVFCAVSHDIVAHETTHALLDGLHPRFQEGTNPDVLAFHEAFADIVAMFQHFTMPEALLRQIKRTRGDLEEESLLGQLAVQFGVASGMHGALRSAIGAVDESTGKWKKAKPSRGDYTASDEPHARGAVLVSAVFAAFVTIYRRRSADLIRLATNGTGVLSAGEISHDLAGRLAEEAAKIADQVLNMCIRALDYCPPVDLTFGDYLRAVITADRDLVPLDDRGYRIAFIAAFRDRGIFPQDVAHLAEDSLVWERPVLSDRASKSLVDLVQTTLDLRWSLNSTRRSAYDTSRTNGFKVWQWLTAPERHELRVALGFEDRNNLPLAGMTGEMRPVEVHSVRPCRRTAPDGTSQAMLVIEITQTFRAQPDQARYRGGCTLLVNLNTNEACYVVRKRLRGKGGAEVQKKARLAAAEHAAERGLRYAAPGDSSGAQEPFALLHRCASRS